MGLVAQKNLMPTYTLAQVTNRPGGLHEWAQTDWVWSSCLCSHWLDWRLYDRQAHRDRLGPSTYPRASNEHTCSTNTMQCTISQKYWSVITQCEKIVVISWQTVHCTWQRYTAIQAILINDWQKICYLQTWYKPPRSRSKDQNCDLISHNSATIIYSIPRTLKTRLKHIKMLGFECPEKKFIVSVSLQPKPI